ncbi:hypothetical protein GCM10023340_01210 [Nocardioides marinquilinus]|uniref:SWIM-type domain-containing protein n=1 Tax=Nocardioides marinquilinus TaxID=1210400 RepID=A0ABP9P818_9ACTN
MSAVVSHPPLAPRRGAARATTWWGRAFVRALEEAAFTERDLRLGRGLARSGSVGGISITAGRLVAAVSDPHGLFTVDARLPVLDAAAQAWLVEAVAAEAGRVGALLAGDLPHDLVEHADEGGAELLPFGSELETTCTCEGWLDPCPHALAVLSQAAWLVDDDPLVLLHLRGLPRDDLLARLHALTAGGSALDPGDDDGGGGGDGGAGGDPALETALDTAQDAAARAARVVRLLEAGDDAIDHLL